MRYCLNVFFVLFIVSPFLLTAEESQDADKKLSTEYMLKQSLAKADLFAVEKWEVIRKSYFLEKEQHARDEIVIVHYKKLYKKHLVNVATQVSIEKGLEIGGIAGAIGLGLGAGSISRMLNLPVSVQQFTEALAPSFAVGGLFAWMGLQLSPTAVNEHSPFSLARDTVKSMRYAMGKYYEDPCVSADELLAKSYFKLLDNHKTLFDKTVSMAYKMRADAIEHVVYYKNYIETAAALPLGDYSFHVNEDAYEKAFKHYSLSVAESMDILVSSFVYWSQTGHLVKENKHPFYFEGVAGSGKTHAAKNLAKILQVPLIEANLDGATYEDIVGTKFEPHLPSSRGRLLEALSSAVNVRDKPFGSNVLLFIDEFDRLLNADDYQSRQVAIFMLKALDRTNFKFYSPYLGVNVTLPSLVILSGNYAIKDEALLNRFDVVKFDGFNLAAKLNIFNEVILPDALESFNLTFDELTANDSQKLNALVESQPDAKGLRYIEKGVNKILIKKVGSWYLTQNNTE